MPLPALLPAVSAIAGRVGGRTLARRAAGILGVTGATAAGVGIGGLFDGNGGAAMMGRRRRRRPALTSGDLRMMHEISNAISKKAAETFINQRVRRS